MAELAIHIGLPKTATTTLQYDVFSAPENRALFIGKFAGDPGPFHHAVAEYLSERLPLADARGQVAGMLRGPGVRVYSNEMISVDSTISWREKLRRLALLFDDREVRVIATLRRPSMHAHSVFAELQATAGWRDFAEFSTSGQADWLDPMVLHEAILASGLAHADNITYFDFDAMIGSGFTCLARAIPDLHVPDRPADRNARARAGSAIVSRPVGLYDLGYAIGRRSGVLRLVPPQIRRVLGAALRRVPLGWRYNVPPPARPELMAELDRRYEAALPRLGAIEAAR